MCAAGGGGGPERACRKHASRGQNLQGANSCRNPTAVFFCDRQYIADTSGFEPELPREAVPKAAAEASAASEAAAREQAAKGGILPTVSSV